MKIRGTNLNKKTLAIIPPELQSCSVSLMTCVQKVTTFLFGRTQSIVRAIGDYEVGTIMFWLGMKQLRQV